MVKSLIKQYLPDEPLMAQAWVDCLRWASGEEKFIEQFRSETGNNWTPGKTSIDRMIDESTGRNKECFEQFVGWFHENVWGIMEEPLNQVIGHLE